MIDVRWAKAGASVSERPQPPKGGLFRREGCISPTGGGKRAKRERGEIKRSAKLQQEPTFFPPVSVQILVTKRRAGKKEYIMCFIGQLLDRKAGASYKTTLCLGGD